MSLKLDVRLDGFADPIGALVRDDNGALSFSYGTQYVQRPNAIRISLSLPLTNRIYGDQAARAFFGNLLQERDGELGPLMAREGLARDDIVGLLYYLGGDCAGAISVLPADAPPTKIPGDYETDYVPLAPQQLAEIIRELHQHQRLPAGMQDPSPLAGVESKIALTLLRDGRFSQPVESSGAPTTHILKVPRRPGEAKQEIAALRLSEACGITTASGALRQIDGIDVVIVTRFDRFIDVNGKIGRCHQEDFAKALGLPADLKYERRGVEGRRFDARAIGSVLTQTFNPAEARFRFISGVIFDLLIGNSDAHAKNHALLYSRGGGAPGLSPRYDLVPTRLNAQFEDAFAFRIGRSSRLVDLSADDLPDLVAAVGAAPGRAAQRVARRITQGIAMQLVSRLVELDRAGMKSFADLIAANLRHVLPLLGLDVPDQAQQRDAFVVGGGGWATS